MKFYDLFSSMDLLVTITAVFGVLMTVWSLAFGAGPIVVGNNPVAIAFDSTHNRMYVTNIANNTVSVIDTNTNTVIAPPIAVGRTPVAIAFDATHDRMYVANSFNRSVSVIDTNTNTVGTPIALGDWPFGIAFNQFGQAFIAKYNNDNLWEIDTNTNDVFPPKPLPVPPFPLGMAFDPEHNTMYVANPLENKVSIFLTDAGFQGLPIAIRNNPFGIAFDAKHNRMYVTNIANNTVSVIDTNTHSPIP